MKRLYKRLLCIPIAFVLLSIALVLVMKYVPVHYTPLMIKRSIQYSHDPDFATKQNWVPLSNISQEVINTIVTSEDSRFWSHNGIDKNELKIMYREYKKGNTKLRGCSTISQQVAKNCFTLCSNSYIRKFTELYWTALIEMIWGKSRILEVYLNIAEMGYGIYGIEAASQKYYHCPASDISIYEVAAIAICMPCPLEKDPLTIWEQEPARIRKLIGSVNK